MTETTPPLAAVPPVPAATPDAPTETATLAAQLTVLAEQLAAAQAEVSAQKDKALRALADADNIRKRSAQELLEARKYAVSDFAREMLNIQDNFARAWEACQALTTTDDAVKNTLVGIKMVSDQLSATFEKFQIQRVVALGQPLNPDLHQAMQEADSDQPAGTIVQELQAGYTIAGRLLRPALVVVSRGVTAKN